MLNKDFIPRTTINEDAINALRRVKAWKKHERECLEHDICPECGMYLEIVTRGKKIWFFWLNTWSVQVCSSCGLETRIVWRRGVK